MVNFESDETFFDISEAIGSKQYVHRTVLSTVIRYTSQFNVNRFYLNHRLGYHAVWTRVGNATRYFTGFQGGAVGYLSESGHGVELDFDIGRFTNVGLGYRYFWRPKSFFSMWPYTGVGGGMEIASLRVTPQHGSEAGNDPLVGNAYGYGVLGILIPLVDVGLRAELRFVSYGALKRLIFSQGIGVFVFL